MMYTSRNGISKVFCCFIFCLNVALVYSQEKKEIFDLSKLNKTDIMLSPLHNEQRIKGFEKIIIIDARPDTTLCFLTKNSYGHISNFDIIGKHFNELIDKGDNREAGRQLIIYIKKILLTRFYQTENGDESDNNLKQAKWLGGLLFKADCYSYSDSSYQPLFRFDTVVTTNSKSFATEGGLIIDSCLYFLAQKIGRIQNSKSAASNKKVSFVEVDRYYKKRFEFSAYKTTNLQKGVYVTFEEFKNDTPAYTDFTVEKKELADGLYIKDSTGAETLTRNVWGYCDGKNVFLKSADNYFMLTRINNAFYLKGAKSIKSGKKAKATSILADGIVGIVRPHSKKTVFEIEQVPLQLDMDSGEVY